MLLRVMVLIAVVNRGLLISEWLRLVALAVVTAAFAIWHYRAGLAAKRSQGEEAPAVTNTFSLSAAIKFGALFAVKLLEVRFATIYSPGFGVYLVSSLACTVDVDAITLSMAKEVGGPDDFARAGTAITIALLSNTIVKCGMVISLGKGPVRHHVGYATAAILATGVALSFSHFLDE